MHSQLVKDRYKQGFKGRTQEYIGGRGTLAIVDEEICMGCTHCFDNCAFESIGMVDRKFALPEYSYTSRKAIIIEENCVGCEKCAIVCPVDEITMVTKHGFEVKDGRVVSTTPAPPPAPRPVAVAPAAAKPPRPPRLRNRPPQFRRQSLRPRRPRPRRPRRNLPLRSQNRKPRRNWRRSNPRNPRRKKKRTRAMRRDGQRLASRDAEGAQGASVDG